MDDDNNNHIGETDVNDWSYFAEGGKHVIFRYHGTNPLLSGRHLLRISKSMLAKLSAAEKSKSETTASVVQMMESPSTTPNNTTEVTTKIQLQIEIVGDFSSQQFQRRIIQPLLCHCYLDLAHAVRLSALGAVQLYHSTLASGLIPSSRISSWKRHDAKQRATVELDNFDEGVKALLLRDHTHVPRHHHCFSNANNNYYLSSPSVVLSAEIKPKAGYISRSPLVHPSNRCKYYRTRYSLQQELIQMGKIHKGWRSARMRDDDTTFCTRQQQSNNGILNVGWDKKIFTPSNYSPLDLFSGNVDRVHKALVDLSCNMQNNFRVWCDGMQIFGEGKDYPSNSFCHTVLKNMLPNFANDFDNQGDQQSLDSTATLFLNVIIKIVTSILIRESPLLSNMLSVQQLDWIDGDGAIMIYDRLVFLCDGSKLEAEALLDAAVLLPDDSFFSTWKGGTESNNMKDWMNTYMTDSSPYTLPTCNALQQLLDEMHHFQNHLHQQEHHCTSSTEQALFHDDLYFRCIQCVNHLSKEACIYLLQNWLLSLSLCDASFFVTFTSIALPIADNNNYDVRQTCDHGGTVVCSLGKSGELDFSQRDVGFLYEVKVIDCDPKPAKKLRDRRFVENAFQFLKTSTMNSCDDDDIT